MATEPLIAVLMLGQLGFAPWQYGLAFAAPCVGGLIGSRLARRLAARFGQHTILRTAGALRACWPVGLAFIRPGTAGLVLVLVVQFGLVTCCGVVNPVLATYRLQQTAKDRVARTLSAWSVSTSAAIAAMTALWGLLASLTSPRIGIAAAGLLILATPLLLPRRRHLTDAPPHETAGGPAAAPAEATSGSRSLSAAAAARPAAPSLSPPVASPVLPPSPAPQPTAPAAYLS
jgi:MFS family permease